MPNVPRKDIGKTCRLAFCGVWSGATLFDLNTGISTTHNNNKNLLDTPYIGPKS